MLPLGTSNSTRARAIFHGRGKGGLADLMSWSVATKVTLSWYSMESFYEVNMPNWVSCKPVFMVWTSFKLALHARKECKLMFRVHWIITSEIFRGLCSVLEVGSHIDNLNWQSHYHREFKRVKTSCLDHKCRGVSLAESSIEMMSPYVTFSTGTLSRNMMID